MNERVILNTHTEQHFEVFNGKEWLRFMVAANRRYTKDSAKDFWLVVNKDTKKEHLLYADKAEELLKTKKLRYV